MPSQSIAQFEVIIYEHTDWFFREKIFICTMMLIFIENRSTWRSWIRKFIVIIMVSTILLTFTCYIGLKNTFLLFLMKWSEFRWWSNNQTYLNSVSEAWKFSKNILAVPYWEIELAIVCPVYNRNISENIKLFKKLNENLLLEILKTV